jgi:hypothetical protein
LDELKRVADCLAGVRELIAFAARDDEDDRVAGLYAQADLALLSALRILTHDDEGAE